MTVQVEPAIALKAEISRTGVVIDDMSKLGNGDKVDIKIVPIVPGTDDVIPDADLPKQISWNIEYMLMVSASTVDEYNDKFLMIAKGMISFEQFLESEK